MIKLCKWFLFLLVFLLCFTTIPLASLAAGEICTTSIRQSYIDGTEINLYIDVLDIEGIPMNYIEKDRVSLEMSGETLQVNSVKPFSDTDEGVACIFLIDISKSVNKSRFDSIKRSIEKWVASMSAKDAAAIITFGEGVEIVQNYTSDDEKLHQCIDDLDTTDNKTYLNNGIVKSLEIARYNDASLPKRRAIIVMTDGKDEGPVGGTTYDEVITEAKETSIPIYSIGSYTGELNNTKKESLDKLGEIARVSGGQYIEMTENIEEIYDGIRVGIYNTYKINAEIESSLFDGETHSLTLSVKEGTKKVEDTLDIKLEKQDIEKSQNEVEEKVEDKTTSDKEANKDAASVSNNQQKNDEKLFDNLLKYWWIAALLIFILIVLIILILIFKNKNKSKNSNIEPTPDAVAEQEPGSPINQEIINQYRNGDYSENTLNGIPQGIMNIKFALSGSNSQVFTFEEQLIDSLLIGRGTEADICIDDDSISEVHSQLIKKDKEVYVVDMESTNGTFVNGNQITQEYKIQSGDMIKIGLTEIRVFLNFES